MYKVQANGFNGPKENCVRVGTQITLQSEAKRTQMNPVRLLTNVGRCQLETVTIRMSVLSDRFLNGFGALRCRSSRFSRIPVQP